MKHATSETINGVATITGIFAGPQHALQSFPVPNEVSLGWIKVGEEWQAPPITEAEILRQSLLSVFSTFAPGVQATFKSVADAMREAFAAGSIPTAKQFLETTPVLPELQSQKDDLLAVFTNAGH